jgi:phosphoglycolate phosphatase-like HAD superfamily hydrolase
MGGDQIIAHVAGDEVERRHGSALRDGWVEEFDNLIDEGRPLDGARDLIEAVKSRGSGWCWPARASPSTSTTSSSCATAGPSPTPGRRPTTSRAASPNPTS